ncbi:tetratricopeptide repeat protein [Nocardia sp. NPDC046763]|uniref:tetratricopeptide repeat protein n=1 Tax=Nocardia sp. NPDC046763 TaxID=3155256 RepID=UPI0033D1E85C
MSKIRVQKNFRAIRDYIRLLRGQLADDPEAWVAAGFLLLRSKYPWQRRLAEDSFRWAAEKGNPVGMAMLAEILLDRGDDTAAEDWYREAAAAGLPVAMHNLGVLAYRRGTREDAIRWFRMGDEAGNPNSPVALAEILGDTAEAVTLLRRTADAGHPVAMNNLGAQLQRSGDHVEAEFWFRRAEETRSDPLSQCNIGDCCARRGDHAAAEHWYRKAAMGWRMAALTGDVDAMFDLAVACDEHGSMAEAEYWYREAATAGDPRAMNNLAILLAERNGDDAESESWLHDAAAAGYIRAMRNLAARYQRRGDDHQAQYWSHQAATADKNPS